MLPPRPVIVSAARSAFTIDSSTASITASYSSLMRRSLRMRSSSSGASVSRPRLPVAKQSAKSPLEISPIPPVRAIPKAGPPREPLTLAGQERSVGRDEDDDRACALAPRAAGPGPAPAAIRSPTGTPFTRSRCRWPWFACTSTPTVAPSSSTSRGGADPALEAVADHARAAADGALVDGAVTRRLERGGDVLRPHVEAVDVVQEAVPRLADDGQAPVGAVRLHCGDQRIADDADRVRVRQRDGRRQEARVAYPLEPGQLAVAVDPVAAGEERLRRRHDDRDARADVRRPRSASCGRRARRRRP